MFLTTEDAEGTEKKNRECTRIDANIFGQDEQD